MDVNKKKLTCEQAKQIDIVTYLSESVFEPAKIRSDNYWYLSPLRTENTPSFKIYRKLNVWYDYGLVKGGNLIDFAILFHDCTACEFPLKWTSNFSFHQPFLYRPSNKKKQHTWEIQRKREGSRSKSLLAAWAKYLNEDITVNYLTRKRSSERNAAKFRLGHLTLFNL